MEQSSSTKPICKDLSICSITWNLHGETPQPSTVNLLLKQDKKYDMYVIGTQECLRSILVSFFISSKKEWEDLLLDNLGRDDYVMVSAETMNAIHIVVIIKKELSQYISAIGSSYVRTGGDTFLGNKGAVFTWFKFQDTPMIFINCHLAAYREFQARRNEHYMYITNNITVWNYSDVFGENIEVDPVGKDVLNKFHFCLWMGDYNSRNDLSGKELLQFINESNVKEILKQDQLNKAIFNNEVDFNGFVEHPIMFPPTYKFNPGELRKYYINEEEGHVPSYTDRIFYRMNPDISGLKINIKTYASNSGIELSDHKPVILNFELSFS